LLNICVKHQQTLTILPAKVKNMNPYWKFLPSQGHQKLTSRHFCLVQTLARPGINRILLFVFAFLPMILFGSCQRGGNAGSNQANTVLAADGHRVKTQPFQVHIRATGNLLSYEEVELKTPVAGTVMGIFFDEGQQVRKGDLLVEIDNRSWMAQKKGLEAQLEFTDSELERKRELLSIEGVSLEEVERTQAEAAQMNARIEELDVMIDLSRVRAPFDGQLGMRDFSLGAYLNQGETITRLVQTNRIRVHFSIPAKYASLARSGQEITLISSTAGDTAMARIYAVDPMISASSRSLQVRALLENSQGRFLPGNFIQVEMLVDQTEEAMLIPAESIIPELGTQVVYVARNGQAVRQEIQIGERTETMVQVLRGLSPGDVVLTTGLMEVRDGIAVQVRNINPEDSL
jgi:membrane fusion protein, multidrug efflux system